MVINRIKITEIIFFAFSVLIFLWIGLNIIRTVINFSKIFTERHLIFASDDKKRFEIFGELHIFLKFIEVHTRNDSAIFFIILDKDIDNRFYYLSYYYLYPRMVNFISKNEIANLDNTFPKGFLVTFGFSNDRKINLDNLNLNLLNVYTGEKYSGSIYEIKK